MKIRALFRPLLFLLVAACFLFGSVVPSRADTLDSFIGAYKKIESYAPPNSLPISSNDLVASKSLFSCLEQGSDAGICIDTFSHTPLGQQVVAESGLPSSFWSVLDAYVAYKNGDIWGVAYSLGEAAVCAVLQVLAGGADICGFIKELVELAESLWDTATAVAEFFADLGEGAWEAAKGAYCDTLGSVFGGCDDDSSPPEAVAYAWVFAPKLADGLTARKAIDPNAFDNLRQHLIGQASANPAQFNIQLPSWVKITFPAAAVSTAAQIYTNTVDQNWSADMTNTVLPALSQKRNGYPTPQKIAQLAGTAATAFKNNNAEPLWVVRKACSDEFKQTFGFAHVDRWITNPNTAQTAAKLKVQSSADWCSGVWNGYKPEFAKTFAPFARNNFCPGTVTPFPCKTIENYQRCITLLGYVGEEEQCGINSAAMGKEAAEKVKQALLNKGSKGNYKVIPPTGSETAATLVSQRPTQKAACEQEYQKLFGSYPAKLVTCTVQEPADYSSLKAAVAQAVASLNSGDTGKVARKKSGWFSAVNKDFVIDATDPLLVWARSEDAYAEVLADKPSFGFGPPSKNSGFEYPMFKQHVTIDGLDTPVISNEKELKKTAPQQHYNPKQKLLDKLGNPDPIDQLTINQNLKSNVSPLAAQKAGSLQNPAMAGAAGQKQQVMSGTLPPGKAPSTGSAAGTLAASKIPGLTAQQTEQAAPKPMMLQLPDLVAAPEVSVAGRPAAWGGTVTIDATAARQKDNGICRFPVQYGVRNIGSGVSAGFATALSVSTNTGATADHSWLPVTPGGSAKNIDTIPLKPGLNQVTLTIDTRGGVKETNERNNEYRLTVTVNGQCGESPLRQPVLRQMK